MTTWTNDELDQIGDAGELRIAARRDDGTLRGPKTIWVVRDGDDLYVRSVRGTEGAWYQGTRVSHEGRIWAGGVDKDVRFVDVDEADGGIAEQVDAAYRDKYGSMSTAVDRITSPQARATTLKLVPR